MDVTKLKKVLQVQYFIEEPKDSNLAVFSQCLYNFHHKICLFPFRVVHNTPWKITVVKPGKRRMVVSILIWCLIFVQSTLWVRQYVKGPAKSEAHGETGSIEVSDSANELGGYLQILGLFQLAWLKRKSSEQFFNLLSHYKCKHAFLKGVIFVAVLEPVYIGGSLVRFLGNLIDLPSSAESLKPIISFTFMGFYPPEEDIVTRYSLTATYVLGTICLEWNISNIDLFLMMSALCLNEVATQFESLCTNDAVGDSVILEEFNRIRSLSEVSSSLLGDPILLHYFAVLGFYCHLLNSAILVPGGPSLRNLILALPYLPVNIVTWGCFARFNHNIGNTTRNWIYRRGDSIEISERKFLMLVSDVQSSRIGVSCRFFTITYGFIGSMIGLILTYSIIMNQQS